MELIDHSSRDIRISEIKNITGYVVLFCLLGLLLFSPFIFELIAVITATVKASKGELYKYPLSIPFIKTESQVITSESQENSSEKKSENEHTS